MPILINLELSDFCYHSSKTVLVDVCNDVKDKYRFGFNGQEKVNEWAGLGNFMEFSERGYDSRIGRFLRVDPITRQYPWNSPFAFAENDVIRSVDLEGKEKYIVHQTRNSDGLISKIQITTTPTTETDRDGHPVLFNHHVVKDNPDGSRTDFSLKEVMIIDITEDGGILRTKSSDKFTRIQQEVWDKVASTPVRGKDGTTYNDDLSRKDISKRDRKVANIKSTQFKVLTGDRIETKKYINDKIGKAYANQINKGEIGHPTDADHKTIDEFLIGGRDASLIEEKVEPHLTDESKEKQAPIPTDVPNQLTTIQYSITP